MAVNKVVYGGQTLVDLTADTVTPATLAKGVTAHNASGNKITGTMKANTPTQFTNLYDPAKVTLKQNVAGSSSQEGIIVTTDNYSNWIKVPFHHLKGEPVVLRIRGIGTVRDRFGCLTLAADGETKVNHYQMNSTSYFTQSYDEYGDATITLNGSIITNYEWYYFAFNFQYIGINSGVTAAKTGPIITINEPIGNGGYAG